MITKKQIEKYSIRLPNMQGWAEIALDDGTGSVLIHSDFGDWAHHWHKDHHGCQSIKHFLVQSGSDHDYMMGKFGGAKTTFDARKTAQLMIDYLKEMNDITEDDIYEKMGKFGEIRFVRVPMEEVGFRKRNRGFAFVTYFNKESA